MDWFALGLDVVFGVVAVAYRAVLHRRRTGDTPFRSGGDGIPGPVAVLGLGVLLAAGPVLSITGVLDNIDLGGFEAVGVAVMAVGIALTAWSQAAMGDSWRIGVDTEERTALVLGGPFRIVRNPIFSSMLLIAFGQVLAVPNLASVIGAVILFVMLEVHVRMVEEPYLLKMHGDSYAEYTRAVGRFAPRLRPARASRS